MWENVSFTFNGRKTDQTIDQSQTQHIHCQEQSHPHLIHKSRVMCDFEEFLFECGHGIVRFKSNCHFRRNDPNKECYSVKVLRNSWKQDGQVCESCLQQGVRFDPRTRKLYQEALIHG
ncbi:hypothetical protein E8E14_012495 [Neopestalotiopsis sp. 37M]|nr:hypothetical protein E8E14_012495 [Neopestalotiopsis sp. 37M]